MKYLLLFLTLLFVISLNSELFSQGKPPVKTGGNTGKPHMGIQSKPGKPFPHNAAVQTKPSSKPVPHNMSASSKPGPGKPAAGIQTKPPVPRPPGSGIRPDCIGPGHKWVPGRWIYNKKTGRQIWLDGYCMTKQGNSIWIEGHYVETPMGPKWVPGRWITRGYPEYKGKR